VSVLRRQLHGFEAFALDAQRVQGSLQRQVVLYPNETPVSHPPALVDVTFEAQSAPATLGRVFTQLKTRSSPTSISS
jgi:hypothetical protein